MLQIYLNNTDGFEEITTSPVPKGAWFNLIKPTAEEVIKVCEETGVPAEFIRAALDEEELPRIELEDNCVLVIFDIPFLIDENRFDTLPLVIIITSDFIITVCLRENKILSGFNKDTCKYFSTSKRTRFLFQILYKTAALYLRYVRHISHLTDKIEKNIRKSMKNKDLFTLLEIEKSLVYFTSSLKDNGIIMEKLLRLRKSVNFQHIIKMYEEDEDLLEDVIIENKQAIEMVEMHSNILSSMMDTFASIISNNLNIVMRFLTSITIILAIPTMIASFWGMNVKVPLAVDGFGFFYIAVFSISLAAITAVVLWKKDMF